MFRRLAALALAASLSMLATSTADARGFAQPPAGAPIPVAAEQDISVRPRIAPAMRARLKRVLAQRRAKNIAAFRSYALRGVYPHNVVRDGALNVWIDEEGHLCAAATMIFRSGAKALVRQIGREDNYIHLADVTEGPVLDWILTSGLTQAEVATIQEPFMRVPQPEPAPQPIVAEPSPVRPSPRALEDQRLAARYREVLGLLASWRNDSLDAAIDRLADRPDLVATLVR
jgi:hypothetical protein